jgi:peptide/nickel transport system permease protein
MPAASKGQAKEEALSWAEPRAYAPARNGRPFALMNRSSHVLRHPFVSFALRRLFSLALVLAGLVVATFLMVRLIPGDPALNIGGPNATEEDLARIRSSLLLDRPLPDQFQTYVQGLARGELGRSFLSRQLVSELIGQRIGTSLQLAAAALALVMVTAVPLGILMGGLTRDHRHPQFEVGFTAVTSILGSVPEFLAATFLAFVFAVWLALLPVAGSGGIDALILPVLAVSIRPAAILMRIVRVETLSTLASDFIRTARGKRLPALVIYTRHTLPNVMTAALTVGGLLFAGIIGGAVVVENVFARAGLGTSLVQAVLARDYPVVQGVVLMLGTTVVVVNAIVDVTLAAIDPRTAAAKV